MAFQSLSQSCLSINSHLPEGPSLLFISLLLQSDILMGMYRIDIYFFYILQKVMVTVSFKNESSSVKIDGEKNLVYYNGDVINIYKKFIVQEHMGKIETIDHIFKWSKNEIYIYNKLTSINFVEKLNQVSTDTIASMGVSTSNCDVISRIEFNFMTGYNIILYKFLDKKYKVEHVKQGDSSEPFIENIVDISGESYTTDNGNILRMSITRQRYTWNGCSICKIN